MDQFENLEAFLREVERLQEAHALLEEVWTALGPYFMPGAKLTPELESKLQKYFAFDDGE